MPEGMSRPESGPMQFGDDWPGVFIRGDNALFMAMALTAILEIPEDLQTGEFRKTIREQALREVIDLLKSCQLKPND